MSNPFNAFDENISPEYFSSVVADIEELKKYYPYTKEIHPPYAKPNIIQLKVVAASANIIKETHALQDDFTGAFSKELRIVIPQNYKDRGCDVYGMSWLDIEKIPYEQRHIYDTVKYCGLYRICVGVPNSQKDMKNPILENVRTADHIMTAYEFFLKGLTPTVQLIEYAHGEEGVLEYEKDKKRYKPKRKD